jgi:GrpB-like predicted nucleotidyltransferase (UPF0157 family)
MNKYVYEPYNKIYPNLFKKEKLKIIKVLGKNILMEHVGSTSVPSLGGKGIIDIAIRTPKDKLKSYVSDLTKIGFEESPNHRIDDRRFFMQKIIKNKGTERRVHIHLCLTNDFFDSFIIFRDHLIKNKRVMEEYAKIKKDGVKYAKGEAQKYRDYKKKFLEETMKKAMNDKKDYIYPSNKAHFKKLIPFAQKIIKICQENGIEPVIYGSFAHFYHTKDTKMKVNDIDLLIPIKGIKKLPVLLNRNKIKFVKCLPESYSLIAKDGSVKVELDDVGTGYKTLNEKSLGKDVFEKIDFYGIPVKMITLEQLEEIYSRALIEAKKTLPKVIKRVNNFEKYLGRKIKRLR